MCFRFLWGTGACFSVVGVIPDLSGSLYRTGPGFRQPLGLSQAAAEGDDGDDGSRGSLSPAQPSFCSFPRLQM